MQNSSQKKQERHIAVSEVIVEVNTDNRETLENIVEFVARDRLIAQQAEDACHLDGNNSSPDFDEFEEKYGFDCFA